MSTAKHNTPTPIDWESRYNDLWRTAIGASHRLMALREVARLASDPNVEEEGRDYGAIFSLFEDVLEDAIKVLDYVPNQPAP